MRGRGGAQGSVCLACRSGARHKSVGGRGSRQAQERADGASRGTAADLLWGEEEDAVPGADLDPVWRQLHVVVGGAADLQRPRPRFKREVAAVGAALEGLAPLARGNEPEGRHGCRRAPDHWDALQEVGGSHGSLLRCCRAGSALPTL